MAINQRILVLLLFQISNDTTIDAGNIINSLDDEAYKINHIFVTHAHLDHVSDIPLCWTTILQKEKYLLLFMAH